MATTRDPPLATPSPSTASGAPIEPSAIAVPSPWSSFAPSPAGAPATSGVKILAPPVDASSKKSITSITGESSPVDWSVLTVNGQRIQGVAEIKPKLELKIDEKNAPGVNGSTVTIQGRKLSKFDITIQFGYYSVDGAETPESQFASIVGLLRSLRPARDTAKPVKVDHPIFDLYGIREVLVTSWEGPTSKSDLWEIKLDALEYRKPSPPKKPATTTPNAANPTSREDFGPGEPDDPSYRPKSAAQMTQAERDELERTGAAFR